MTPRELSALVSTILVIVGTAWYIRLILKGEKVKPVIATWIVLTGTMALSFATYWTTPNHSLVSNACNAISVLSTSAILIATICMERGNRISFTKFQKICLWVSLAITTFWVVLVWGFKGTGIIPNILTQVLMLIGYLVTAEKLWFAKKNTESIFTWWCILLAGAVALYTGIVSHDSLVILYAGRTTFGTVVLVWLMYRVELKELIVHMKAV
jgi:hypothetical protein